MTKLKEYTYRKWHGLCCYLVVYLILIVSITQTSIGGYRVYATYLPAVYLPLFMGFVTVYKKNKINCLAIWFFFTFAMFVLVLIYGLGSEYSIFFSQGQCGQSSCYTNRDTPLPYNAGGTLGNAYKQNIYIPLCPVKNCRVASVTFQETPIGVPVLNTPIGYYKNATGPFADLSRPCPVDEYGNCDYTVCDCYGSTLSQDYERNKGIGIINTVTLNMKDGLQPCPGAALSNRPSSLVCTRCTMTWIARGLYDPDENDPNPKPVINPVCNASQAYEGDCFRCVGYAPGESWDAKASNAYFALYVITCIFIGIQLIYSAVEWFQRREVIKKKNKENKNIKFQPPQEPEKYL